MPKAASRKARKKQPKKPPVLQSPAKREPEPLLSAWQLLKNSLTILWNNKKLFAGIVGIVGITQMLVVQGVIRTDFVAMDKEIRTLVGSSTFGLGGGLVSYAYLLGASGQGSGTGLLQSLFLVFTILILIWTLRELTAGNQPRIRDAFYKSTAPLIPFILVSLWLAVQLLPALLGGWLYSVIMTNTIAVNLYEQLFWLLLFIALSLLSLRFICGTIFALIIATLPDMAPVAAIRSARNLVQGRRVRIIAKLLFLGLALLIGMTTILVPIIIVMPALVPILFYVTSLLALGLAVTYIYLLYKELLK